jgi:hypothetical protein
MKHSTMKYGMFVHYVEGLSCRRDGTIPPFGQAAEEFDVAGFADSLVSFGAVAPSIKSTIPSTSFMTRPGDTIQDLTWGVATSSADGKTEYLHVLKPPSGNRLVLPAPSDGKKFRGARLLATGEIINLDQTQDSLSVTMMPGTPWDDMDTVIVLHQ